MKTLIFLLILLLFNCLSAKKSPFDFRSPSMLFGSLFFASQAQQSGNLSVSGSISGFTSGTLILQNNGANDLTLSSTDTQYSFGGLASGSKYAITIKSNPVGFVCSVTNASGTITANVTNVNVSCNVITVSALYPTNGANWNDYINRDFSKDIFSQTDTTCNTANTGGYRTCVHAGEIRKFDIASRSSCTGLTATDNLSVMNWICKTNSSGGVTFYSSALGMET